MDSPFKTWDSISNLLDKEDISLFQHPHTELISFLTGVSKGNQGIKTNKYSHTGSAEMIAGIK